MGFGAGIILLVVGLVLVTGAVDLPQAVDGAIATNTVGWICVVVGVLALLLPLALSRRSRTRVEEHHYN
jgi:hypothetical protein